MLWSGAPIGDSSGPVRKALWRRANQPGLPNAAPLEQAQHLAGHVNPRTTQIY